MSDTVSKIGKLPIIEICWCL